ncbi:MAG: heavy metal translocating P-type ATPase [Phycisphaerales bacterium]
MTQAPSIPVDGRRQPTAHAVGVIRCSHCGLDVPEGLVAADRPEQFCCAGCESVWNVLHGAGLEAYYEVRDAVETNAQRPITTGGSFEEFASPAYQRAFVRPCPGGLCETEFLLEGVHCAACVWLLERLPRVAPGVAEARVGLRSGVLRVWYRPNAITLPDVARRLDRLGYRPHPARGKAAREARAMEDRMFLVRVAVAGACAGNIMLFAVALYSGAISGIDSFWESLFRWLSMGLALVSLSWPGRVFFRGALSALRTRTAHLDLPIAIALAAGGAWGVFNTIRGEGQIYFDTLSVLVFLLLVGRWVQQRQHRAAIDSIELMLSLAPSVANVVGEDGVIRAIPIDSVEVRDLVEVRAGDTIPADGVIESGISSVDEAILTGESLPRSVAPGDDATAGATNLRAPLRLRVTAIGDQTRVGRLMKLVADAGARRAPIVRAADRVAGWFVLAVIMLALVTVAIWAHAGVHTALEHATALLIVACPCGLGLATGLAMGVAAGRAARHGALVKDAGVLQALASPGLILLDKTGTITEGRASLVGWRGDAGLRPLVAALELGSSHPIALALAKLADEPHAVADREHTPGGGVRGTVSGVRLAAGSPSYLESLGVPIEVSWREQARAASLSGRTPLLVASGGRVAALAELGDAVRTDASASVERLRARGWEVRVLSGDQQGVVDAVCRQIGLDGAGEGGVSPEGKAATVERLRRDGRRVVMVGDGVNDAAAMASASVGIGVHGGAEASLEAADVYLTDEGLAPIVELIDRSHGTMRIVWICLTVSALYNAIAAGLAMVGLMSALLAAVLMPVSSLAVVAIALHAGRLGNER